jgi:hypothetical protein
MTMEVTQERLKEIKFLIKSWLDRDLASLKAIQILLGKLNFVGACVRSSRVFVNRILNWLQECYAEGSNQNFLIPLEELHWWNDFLPIYNGISLIDYGEWSEMDSVFSSDACLTGCGNIFGNKYFHNVFPKFMLVQNLGIV